MNIKEIVYIACPYYHESDIIRDLRAEQISQFTAKLVKEGTVAFSPITYGHELLKHEEMPGTYDFWETFCLSFLSRSTKMIVYMMDGWDKSNGVKMEIEFCVEHNIPVEYVEFNEKNHK